jgi:hypothetical protein
MQAAADKPWIAYRTLVDLGITSSTLYVCSGKDWITPQNGMVANTYTPVGGLGEISAIQEEVDNFPRDITMRVAAITSSQLYEPMQENMFNRSVRVSRTFLDPITRTMVSTPELMWKGKVAEVNVYPDLGYTEIRAETVLRRTAKVQYFNRETYQAIDSSDTFGVHVDQIPLFKSQWGQQPTTFQSPSYLPNYHLWGP